MYKIINIFGNLFDLSYVSLKMIVRQLFRVTLLSFVTILFVSCESGPDYKEAIDSQYGYKDHKITDKDYIITFNGRFNLDRALVEKYLLRRAAEVAKKNNHEYFVVMDLSIDSETSTPNPTNVIFSAHPYFYNHAQIGLHSQISRSISSNRFLGKVTIRLGKFENEDLRTYKADEILSNVKTTLVLK